MRATVQSKVTGDVPNLITQAEHARRCDVSRKSVTIWKERGQLVLSRGLVDFERSYKGERWHASVKKAISDMTSGAAGVAGASASRRAPSARRGLESPRPVPLRRDEILKRLRGLDWTQAFDWSDDAQRARAAGAATAVGLQAVRSEASDDGHWGGVQLRNPHLLKDGLCFEALVAGHGFELDEVDVLMECRECLWHETMGPADLEDELEIRLDLLPLLAYPFHERHQAPAGAANVPRTTP